VLGRTLGSYKLQAHIGSGGMGVVYRAEHTLIGRRAAVKVLLPEYSTRQDLIKRFFNEARAAASAQHPGIVEVYDFGQAPDGTAYLVMELLEGDTLWQRLRKAKKLPERQALIIARQIAAALAAAHQAGVIHRDLKPGNIFLLPTDEPGGIRVKLMDFGVAKLVRDDSGGEGLTTTGAIVGTPVFMSPEQCRGGGTPIDWRSDLYSLGCIMFAMLAGRPPFVADGSGAVLAMHIYEPVSRVKAFQPVSDEVDRLVHQLLSKRPEERATEIREVATILAEMAPTEEGRRRSSTPLPPTAPTVMEDDAVTAPRATAPPAVTVPPRAAAVTAPPAHVLVTTPPAGAPAFVVPASAVPALRDQVPVLRDQVPALRDQVPPLRDQVPALRDKPAPVAFPRPATTMRSGTPPPAAPRQQSPAAGPLAPTMRAGTPAPAPPGGGVAVAVAVTVPAAAAAPPAPPMVALNQALRGRSETPASWPDGTPTARTTVPPPRGIPRRRAQRRSAGPLVAVVLGLAVLGGGVFAAFQLGLFGGGGDGEAKQEPRAAPPPAEPAPRETPAPAMTVVKDAEVRPAAAEPPPPAATQPPAAAAQPPAAEAEPRAAEARPEEREATSRPARAPARGKKRVKKGAPSGRPTSAPTESPAEDNVIDPFR